MKKKNKILLSFLILILLLSGAVFAYAGNYYHADETALKALESTSTVKVEYSSEIISFLPVNGSSENKSTENKSTENGFIFYPGGKVEYTSYAPLLHKLAENGIPSFVIRMPLNLAFLGVSKAETVMKLHPEIKNWTVGGHSLGGVAASSFVSKNAEIEKIVFLGSYPANKIDCKILFIYGNRDLVVGAQKYEKVLKTLPEDAIIVEIDGGNHAQFGSYGAQKGDSPSTVSPDQQLEITVAAIVRFIDNKL